MWRQFGALNDWLLYSMPPGGLTLGGILQPRLAINLHKLLVLPAYSAFALLKANPLPTATAAAGGLGGVTSLLSHLGPLLLSPSALASAWAATSPSARLLAGFHASYGLLWCIKDICYPDAAWAKSSTLTSTVFLFVNLCCLYYPAGYFAINAQGSGPSIAAVSIATLSYALGILLHFGADIQKYTQLHICKKKGLITNGLFAYTRNPNYLGECLIYSAFCILSGHSMPWILTVTMWAMLFYPNMMAKDQSISRHPGWASYIERANLIVPNPLKILPALLLALTPNSKDGKGQS